MSQPATRPDGAPHLPPDDDDDPDGVDTVCEPTPLADRGGIPAEFLTS